MPYPDGRPDDFNEILDAVVARTRARGLRDLCDPGHPKYHPRAWRSVVMLYREERVEPQVEPELAGDELAAEPPRGPTLDEAIADWWAASVRLWRGDRPCCGGGN